MTVIFKTAIWTYETSLVLGLREKGNFLTDFTTDKFFEMSW